MILNFIYKAGNRLEWNSTFSSVLLPCFYLLL